MPKQKRLLALLLVIIMLASLAACSDDNEPIDPEFTEKLRKDADAMLKSLELYHIIFAQDLVPEGYYTAKMDFLLNLENMKSYDEFFIEASIVLATLNDRHTSLYEASPQMLDFKVRYLNEKLIATGGKLPEGAEIISIGGKDIGEITELAGKVCAAENKSGLELNIENYSRMYSTLSYLGCEINDNNETKVDYLLNGVQDSVFAKFIAQSAYAGQSNNSHYMDDGVFIFQLGQCQLDSTWEAARDAMVEYVEDGGRSVIIDVRDCPGGNSLACSGILDALGMQYGNYGGAVYINAKTYSKFEAERSDIGKILKFPPTKITGSTDIDLIVLTSKRSGGGFLTVYVQDSGLGKIVGEISSNAPSSYGDSLYTTLPNSKFTFSYSWKQFLRPDANASQTEIVPDYITGPDEDAMDVAMSLLNNGLR